MGMILAWSAGSAGDGVVRYSLYVPLVPAQGREITLSAPPGFVEVAGLRIGLERTQNYLALRAGDFGTAAEARVFRDRLLAGVLWATLQHKIGVSIAKTMQDVKLHDPAIVVAEKSNVYPVVESQGWSEIDGEYDADKAAVIPEHMKLLRWETGRGSVTTGIGDARFLESIVHALCFPAIESVIANEKLRLAIELHSASFFEASVNAQFLTLVSALEALTPDQEIPVKSRAVLRELRDLVKSRRDEHGREDVEWSDLDHLLSRVGQLKRDSIGASMRAYFSAIVQRSKGLGEVDDVVTALTSTYGTRSKLLHDGVVEPGRVSEGLKYLRGFVPAVLKIIYEEDAA